MILIKLKCVSCLFSKKALSNAITIVDGMALCETCCREHLKKVEEMRKELERKKAKEIPKKVVRLAKVDLSEG